jgi:hypothetical protein
MDKKGSYVAYLFQPEILPGLSFIRRLIHPFAEDDVASQPVGPSTDIHDIRV